MRQDNNKTAEATPKRGRMTTKKAGMSLLSELQELEPGYNGMTPWVVEDNVPDATLVHDEITGTGRWTTKKLAVFARGEELVGLEYEEPATEMQEGGDFFHRFFVVEPHTVETIEYREVKDA